MMRLWVLCHVAVLGLCQLGVCAVPLPEQQRRLFVPQDQGNPAPVQNEIAKQQIQETPTEVPQAESSEQHLEEIPTEIRQTGPSDEKVLSPELAFPPMPENRAPSHPDWDNSIAICTCIKNENTADLLEWVAYHKWRGVDHISILENNFTVSTEMQDALSEHISSGFVEYDAFGTDHPSQTKAFASCFAKMRRTHNWVAFIDVDEFLVLLDKEHDNLKSFLDEYKEYPALAVNWIMYGPSGRQKRPPNGGVLRWYFQCNKETNRHIKSIANSYYVLSFDGHPHNFYYRGELQAVAEDFEPIGWMADREPRCNLPDDEVTGAAWCRNVPGDTSSLKEAKRITLLHYVTKSWEDFEAKMKRGSGNSPKVGKKEDYYRRIEANTKQVGGICDQGIVAWDDCCSKAQRTLR